MINILLIQLRHQVQHEQSNIHCTYRNLRNLYSIHVLVFKCTLILQKIFLEVKYVHCYQEQRFIFT